jgi:hypothetical protein
MKNLCLAPLNLHSPTADGQSQSFIFIYIASSVISFGKWKYSLISCTCYRCPYQALLYQELGYQTLSFLTLLGVLISFCLG